MRTWIPRAAVLTVVTSPLFAHAEGHLNEMSAATAMAMGFLHPITGWDHLLAMITVGALGVTLGDRHRIALPVTFLGALAVGGLIALAGVPLVGAEWIISGSVVAFGAFLALANVPKAVLYAAVAISALVHGHAHLAEIPDGAGAFSFGAGMLMGSALLHGVGMVGALAIQKWSSTIVLRRLGGLVVASGAVMLGLLALH